MFTCANVCSRVLSHAVGSPILPPSSRFTCQTILNPDSMMCLSQQSFAPTSVSRNKLQGSEPFGVCPESQLADWLCQPCALNANTLLYVVRV